MDTVKRERSANFTLSERDILVSLVQKYQHILENKCSDATTWKKKENAWENIENEFNARSGSTFRSIKTLRIKYEGLKRQVRKKSAMIRSELYRTGGGKNLAIPLDNVEERVKSMISLSVDGLESIYDSDIIPPSQESQDCINIATTEEFLSSLPQLLPTENTSAKVVEQQSSENQVVVLLGNECEALPLTSSPGEAFSANTGKENKPSNLNVHDQALCENPSGIHSLTPTTSTYKKWDVTSRRNLKSKKHPALNINTPKRATFDDLTQAKLELVQLQKKLLEMEIKEKQYVWKYEEDERKKESEFRDKERQMKLEILKKQLNE